MALDFDVDDGPSFQDLVLSGRRDVLKGRAMAQCWSDLADQHPFFKDIAKEGRLRGETLGVVLAAVEGLSRVIQQIERNNVSSGSTMALCAPSPPVKKSAEAEEYDDDDLLNAQVLVRVTDAYLQLYSTTPVPTRAQWLASLRAAAVAKSTTGAAGVDAAVSDTPVVEPVSLPVAATPSSSPPASSSSSAVGRYLGKLRATLSAVSATLTGDDEDDDNNDSSDKDGSVAGADGEDGSFAEDELKELMRCCMAAGRRAARHPSLAKAEAKTVREMVKALQDFVGSSTLEW